MTLTGDILSSEGRSELLVPMYLYLLAWFFLYCYPIARATVAVERRFRGALMASPAPTATSRSSACATSSRRSARPPCSTASRST